MNRFMRAIHVVIISQTLCIAMLPVAAFAHCDTLGGPVIADAKAAIGKNDVTPVLKWVRPADEQEIKAAFAKTLKARVEGPEAAELADRYFFETLVRVHRAGEGAPFEGLKDDDKAIEPGIEAADHALTEGHVDEVARDLSEKIEKGVRDRFNRVVEAKKHKDESVEAGREFVEAYVTYIHFVERLYSDATPSGGADAAHVEHEH